MVLISLISLRRLLRQRGFVSFRLLFLATTQRVSRCSLPSLRGRGWGEGHFYVFYYLCHYVIMASASLLLYLYILSPLCLYVIMSSVPLLLCLLHTLSLMSLCHSGFCSSVTMSFTYSVPYVFMSFWLLFHCYYVFTYSVPYVFMSFWLHKCKVFLRTSYFVGNL